MFFNFNLIVILLYCYFCTMEPTAYEGRKKYSFKKLRQISKRLRKFKMFVTRSLKKNRQGVGRTENAKKLKMDSSQHFIDYDMEDGSMPSPMPFSAFHESTSFYDLPKLLQKSSTNHILDISMEEQFSPMIDSDDEDDATMTSNNSYQCLQIVDETKNCNNSGVGKNVEKVNTPKLNGSCNKLYKRSVSDVTNEATDHEVARHRAAEKIDKLCTEQGETLSLPTIKGQKSDCNSISCQTMCDLLEGKYKHIVPQFHVIDCRYPYEFNGGHIKGAVNIHNKEEIITNYMNKEKIQKVVLIFHCEFSSKRGPTMYNYLRKSDRNLNYHDYPALHYPEIYLLDGGYKAFWNYCPDWCDPRSYKTMDDINHQKDLRYFKSKSKTWTSGEGKGYINGKPLPLDLFNKENKKPSKKFSKIKSHNIHTVTEASPCQASSPFILSSSPSIDNPHDIQCIFNFNGSAQKTHNTKDTSSPSGFRRKLNV